MTEPIPTIALTPSRLVPVLGQGTWRMGEDDGQRAGEIAALRLGIDMGMTLIDTAEMYGNGGSELVVGEAIAGMRDKVQLVSKVLPGNASRAGTIAACERSLKRLGTGHLDLYLLHWRGQHPLEETVAAFEILRDAGKIREWGVSNFDVDDMEELLGVSGGNRCVTNQVLYNLEARGIEFDLLPWCRARRMPVMAYAPLGNDGRLLRQPQLVEIARGRGVTPAQVALAFTLQDGTISIPKASSAEHLTQNREALDLALTDEERALLDKAFPPPARKQSLDMI